MKFLRHLRKNNMIEKWLLDEAKDLLNLVKTGEQHRPVYLMAFARPPNAFYNCKTEDRTFAIYIPKVDMTGKDFQSQQNYGSLFGIWNQEPSPLEYRDVPQYRPVTGSHHGRRLVYYVKIGDIKAQLVEDGDSRPGQYRLSELQTRARRVKIERGRAPMVSVSMPTRSCRGNPVADRVFVSFFLFFC